MATKEWKEQQDLLLSQVAILTKKPRLLLHTCCAPCSSSVLELLEKYFTISAFFYNPNIFPQSEYFRRHEELVHFLQKYHSDVELIDCDNFYDYNDVAKDFYDALDIRHHEYLEKEKERGKRCQICYSLRLKKTFEYALNNGFDWVATTLTVSPRKDATMINQIGLSIEKSLADNNDGESVIHYLVSDFKKSDGYLRSVQLSKKYGLYRQEYCGCEYSK